MTDSQTFYLCYQIIKICFNYWKLSLIFDGDASTSASTRPDASATNRDEPRENEIRRKLKHKQKNLSGISLSLAAAQTQA